MPFWLDKAVYPWMIPIMVKKIGRRQYGHVAGST